VDAPCPELLERLGGGRSRGILDRILGVLLDQRLGGLGTFETLTDQLAILLADVLGGVVGEYACSPSAHRRRVTELLPCPDSDRAHADRSEVVGQPLHVAPDPR